MKDLGSASSIGELLEAAKDAETAFREMPWFRGHASASWNLTPSAHRRHPVLETQFAQHFRLRAPSISQRCPAHQDTAAWLPLMRHYGLPTRLLDWSESVLVAAYFAIDVDLGCDHAIWVLSPGALNETSIGGFIPFLTDERVKPLVSDAFGAKIAHTSPACLATLAPRTDQRMAAQLGNYTIHGTRDPLENHEHSSNFVGRIIIPSGARSNIRRELSLAGVRTSALFPDLESLAREISDLRALDKNGNELEFDG